MSGGPRLRALQSRPSNIVVGAGSRLLPALSLGFAFHSKPSRLAVAQSRPLLGCALIPGHGLMGSPKLVNTRSFARSLARWRD